MNKNTMNRAARPTVTAAQAALKNERATLREIRRDIRDAQAAVKAARREHSKAVAQRETLRLRVKAAELTGVTNPDLIAEYEATRRTARSQAARIAAHAGTAKRRAHEAEIAAHAVETAKAHVEMIREARRSRVEIPTDRPLTAREQIKADRQARRTPTPSTDTSARAQLRASQQADEKARNAATQARRDRVNRGMLTSADVTISPFTNPVAERAKRYAARGDSQADASRNFEWADSTLTPKYQDNNSEKARARHEKAVARAEAKGLPAPVFDGYVSIARAEKERDNTAAILTFMQDHIGGIKETVIGLDGEPQEVITKTVWDLANEGHDLDELWHQFRDELNEHTDQDLSTISAFPYHSIIH